MKLKELQIILLCCWFVNCDYTCYGENGVVYKGFVIEDELLHCQDAKRIYAQKATFENCYPGFEYHPNLQELILENNSSLCRCINCEIIPLHVIVFGCVKCQREPLRRKPTRIIFRHTTTTPTTTPFTSSNKSTIIHQQHTVHNTKTTTSQLQEQFLTRIKVAAGDTSVAGDAAADASTSTTRLPPKLAHLLLSTEDISQSILHCLDRQFAARGGGDGGFDSWFKVILVVSSSIFATTFPLLLLKLTKICREKKRRFLQEPKRDWTTAIPLSSEEGAPSHN